MGFAPESDEDSQPSVAPVPSPLHSVDPEEAEFVPMETIMEEDHDDHKYTSPPTSPPVVEALGLGHLLLQPEPAGPHDWARSVAPQVPAGNSAGSHPSKVCRHERRSSTGGSRK